MVRPSESIFANRPKITENITIIIMGCKIAQAEPSTVCLYRTENSRQMRKPSNSRRDHISRQSMPIHPERGQIISS